MIIIMHDADDNIDDDDDDDDDDDYDDDDDDNDDDGDHDQHQTELISLHCDALGPPTRVHTSQVGNFAANGTYPRKKTRALHTQIGEGACLVPGLRSCSPRCWIMMNSYEFVVVDEKNNKKQNQKLKYLTRIKYPWNTLISESFVWVLPKSRKSRGSQRGNWDWPCRPSCWPLAFRNNACNKHSSKWKWDNHR